MKASWQSSTLKRKKNLHDVQGLIEYRRQYMENRPLLPDKVRPDALQEELQDEMLRERYTGEWTRLVRRKTEIYQHETKRLFHEALPVLEHFVERYKHHFPILQKEEQTPVLETPEESTSVEEEGAPAESMESTQSTKTTAYTYL